MAKASRTVEMVLPGGELGSPRSAKHSPDAADDGIGLFQATLPNAAHTPALGARWLFIAALDLFSRTDLMSRQINAAVIVLLALSLISLRSLSNCRFNVVVL